MSADDEVLIDTRDMVAVHRAFVRALGDAPGQIESISDGDIERAQRLTDYLGEVLWLLHAHHEGEDELLYPLLLERLPQHRELFTRMDVQHSAISSSLEEAELAVERFGASGSAADGRASAVALTELLARTVDHLDAEEEEVLPIASRVISPPEWGAMPAHALSHYSGERVWLPFGLAFESMPEDMQESLLEHLPAPARAMWLGGGSAAFTIEISAIRTGTF